MNKESICESDLSESWSLIDMNLSQESVAVIDSESKLEETYLLNPKDENLKKSDSTEFVDDFLRRCEDSVTDFSVENQEILRNYDSDRDSDRNDSGDSESIEILDLDLNAMDSETEKFNVSMIDNEEVKHDTYQSDDEESLNGNNDNKFRNTCLAVIKKKRNFVGHSESSENVVNSDSLPNGNHDLKDHPSDDKRLNVQSCAMISLPVYKHYRNNFVNTVLSVSVGVVFAGVACIAIGHFLGVHDASETAVELVNALKKLQTENVALQSRLSQLNKVVLKEKINSEVELPQRNPLESVSYEEKLNYGPGRKRTTNINDAALSEIRSSLKSIQLLTKLEEAIKEKSEYDDDEVDFSSVGKYIHDQINILNDKKVEGFKLLEDSDKKISKILQRIIERLSTSQENIEKLYNKLIRMKDKMNNKLAKLISGKSPRRGLFMESDVNCMHWYPNVDSFGKESSKTSAELKVPRPEELHKPKNDSILTEELEVLTNNNNNNNNNNNDYNINANNINNNCNNINIKRKRKIVNGKKKRKKRERNVRKMKAKVLEKKSLKKLQNVAKIDEAGETKKFNTNGLEQTKYAFERFNDTRENYKKFSKEKKEKPERKMKKGKKSKMLRRVSSREDKKKNWYRRICSSDECYNLTGYWVFKYANGREEFRRHHTLSDWQFERARGRKEQRDDDDVGSWQFRRALARENGRNDHSWHSERYRKNHDWNEDFSWM